MATKEMKHELEIALKEIGTIKPWFDKEYRVWMFSCPLYPVECEGNSAEEVIEKYPQYLSVFIEHRMIGRIDEVNEKKTKGKGGYRPGAGRPKGIIIKEPKKRVSLPVDIADWISAPETITHLRALGFFKQT